MTMMRYEPWSLLGQLSRELGRMPDVAGAEDSAATSDWSPAVDIREEDDAYVLYADIPGVDPKDIELHMENGVLTLRGERRHESEEEQNGYKRIERMRGSFFRRFSLPDTADADNITARSENGVLEVRIPKQARVQPRRIEISS